MANVKEMRLSVQSMLILMLSNMGMDTPENIEEITDFVLNDVQETADPDNWHSGDVAIGFRRWVEAQAKPVNMINEYCPHCTSEVELKDEFKLQECPSCGETLKPCNICEDMACNKCPLEPKLASIGSKISTVKELRYLLDGLDDQDQICIETCDEHGDTQDLFPMYMDVIDGIQLTDGTEINEVRFCQIPNSEPDTRNKQPIIDAVIAQIIVDATINGDTTVIDELLQNIPFEILLNSFPEEHHDKYRKIALSDERIWSEIRCEHEDDDGYVHVDGYLTGDDNEEGKVIAKIRTSDYKVTYIDERARYNKYVQEVIYEFNGCIG